MKYLLGLALLVGLSAATARAQSTMPAMGANTPKGEVAKTDASVNPTSAASRANSSSPKTTHMPGKRMHKSKTVKMKTTSTM